MKPVAAADPRSMFDQVPFMRLLAMRREFSEAGRARLVIDERPEIGNVIGAVHGGVLATLLDVVMASAAVSKVDFARTAVTLDLDTRFLAPGSGRLTADGEVVAHDGDLAWCRAAVTDSQGRTIAQAQGSFRYLALPAAHPSPQDA
jgi:uncharacterized protein (TIGR00369 family)